MNEHILRRIVCIYLTQTPLLRLCEIILAMEEWSWLLTVVLNIKNCGTLEPNGFVVVICPFVQERTERTSCVPYTNRYIHCNDCFTAKHSKQKSSHPPEGLCSEFALHFPRLCVPLITCAVIMSRTLLSWDFTVVNSEYCMSNLVQLWVWDTEK